MCTFTLAWQVFPEAPILVAANRDERLDRPAEPPARRDWTRPVVAPQDRQAAGTWIGYNDAGLLVAITNRWIDSPPSPDRSRGLLVRDALGYETAEGAARYVEEEVTNRSYDAFNLAVVDESAAILLEWDGTLAVRLFEPGVHVLVNVGADGTYTIPKRRQDAAERQAQAADRLRAELAPEPGESADGWLDRAKASISDHEFGVCVHGDGFGTRSSSALLIGPDTRQYEFADGPPCETPYREIDANV